jgi:hypothetical protein
LFIYKGCGTLKNDENSKVKETTAANDLVSDSEKKTEQNKDQAKEEVECEVEKDQAVAARVEAVTAKDEASEQTTSSLANSENTKNEIFKISNKPNDDTLSSSSSSLLMENSDNKLKIKQQLCKREEQFIILNSLCDSYDAFSKKNESSKENNENKTFILS